MRLHFHRQSHLVLRHVDLADYRLRLGQGLSCADTINHRERGEVMCSEEIRRLLETVAADAVENLRLGACCRQHHCQQHKNPLHFHIHFRRCKGSENFT